MRSGEQQQGEISDPTNDAFFAISSDGQIFVYTDYRTGVLECGLVTRRQAGGPAGPSSSITMNYDRDGSLMKTWEDTT